MVNGVIGTAAAQGLLALIGFWIAGVPGAIVLGILTFVLSLVPMGPPLVWIPATAWLVWQGDYGFALFLGVWGMFVISGVDNILKPYPVSYTHLDVYKRQGRGQGAACGHESSLAINVDPAC